MARLPQAADLQRRQTPAESQNIRVGQIDFGAAAAGDRAIAEGAASIGKAASRWGEGMMLEQDQREQFETNKKMLDFKLATEMDLEDQKRSMPVGGTGYTANWAGLYQQRAKEFVGDKDGNIPASQRGRVGLALKQFETQLQERAQRDEYAERDRHTISGLETTVTAYRSQVEADPTRHDSVQAELQNLIESAPITPAQRDAYRRKVRESVQEAAGQAWADRATTAEGRAAALKILAPNAPDKPVLMGTSYLDEIKKSEGFTAQAKWDYKQHSNGYGTRAKFAGEQIDKVEADRRFSAEMGNATRIVDQFAPNLPAGTKAALASLTFNAGDDWTRSGLGKAIQSGDMDTAKRLFLQYNKADGETLPGLVARRQKEVQWFGKDDAGGSMPIGEVATGPLADLPLAKRRALAARAEERFSKETSAVQTLIKDQMAASEKGVLPPDDWMKAVMPRVQAMNDPTTSAMFSTMLGKAQYTADYRTLPPAVQEYRAQNARRELMANGGTKEQEQFVEHQERMAAEAKRQLAENSIGWAVRNQPPIPLIKDPDPEATKLVAQGRFDEAALKFPGHYGRPDIQPIHFGAPDVAAQLDQRFRTADGITRYNGQPSQVFAPNEKQAIGNVLKAGGDGMLHVMGHIAAAAERANVDASMVLKEVAPKDAPEIAMVGHLIGSRGDPATLRTAAAALKWRIGQGERFESTIQKAQAQPSLGEYDEMFKTAPTARDSLHGLANLVYEYESRQKGISAKFDQTLYTSIVHRLMGQTEDGGTVYGGVGKQGAGWFDGKWSSQVLVPPQVKQDSFDSMLTTLRADDLPKMGGIPKDAQGNAYSIKEVRGMTWESVGPPGAPPVAGVYLLKVKDDAGGKPIYARGENGQPLVVDMRPLLGDLQKRKPSIFQGYKPGVDADQASPDPAYPTGYTPPDTKPVDPSKQFLPNNTVSGDPVPEPSVRRRSTLKIPMGTVTTQDPVAAPSGPSAQKPVPVPVPVPSNSGIAPDLLAAGTAARDKLYGSGAVHGVVSQATKDMITSDLNKGLADGSTKPEDAIASMLYYGADLSKLKGLKIAK